MTDSQQEIAAKIQEAIEELEKEIGRLEAEKRQKRVQLRGYRKALQDIAGRTP